MAFPVPNYYPIRSVTADTGHREKERIFLNKADCKPANNRLSSAFYHFLFMASCFGMVQLILNTFLSTYTLAATSNAENVKVFNIVLALVQPFAMLAAIVMIRKYSAIRAQQIGLSMLALVNIYLFMAVESAVKHIFLIAALQSAANGFYFTTYACQFTSYTSNENRDRASGLMNLISNAISLAFSMGSSLLFASFPWEHGYRIIFLISSLSSLAALAVTFRLSPLTMANEDHKVYYLYAHREILKNKWARNSMLETVIEGMRAGPMAFFLNMLLYSQIKSEALVGLNTFLTTLGGIIACAVYVRVVHVQTRYRSAKLSIFAMLAATALLFGMMNPAGIILYGVISSILSPFFCTPLANVYWTVLEKVPELQLCRAEVHAAREVYYALGRTIGIALTIFLPSNDFFTIVLLLCLMGIQYVGLLLSQNIMRDLDMGNTDSIRRRI
jgi:YQGE family putative transporter